MLIDKNYKLHKITKKEYLRPALENIKFDGKSLIAVNNYAIAIVPVADAECNTETLIHRDDFIKSTKGSKNQSAIINSGEQLEIFDPKENKLVPCEKSTDTFPIYERCLPTSEITHTVAINAKLLYELSQALGSHDLIKLAFHSKGFSQGSKYNNCPLTVTPYDADNKATGILMTTRH